MNEVDDKLSFLHAQVDALRVAESQRQRAEAGMMHFARATQSRLDELAQGYTDLAHQQSLLSKGSSRCSAISDPGTPESTDLLQ